MNRWPIICLASFTLLACSAQPNQLGLTDAASLSGSVSQAQTPEWAKDAVIYQLNTRQYSKAGTFEAVEADLARIKTLGVDILWLMPIHPIGEEKRKGSMGSPYAVQDFRKVNPELGTLEDFKSLVDAAHALDMKVIIDWVANHTAWDNHLIIDHPEWYTRDETGHMQHPEDTDWLDVADLDYEQQGLRNYMKESLVYWIRDIGIDGYRCDVAGMVPTDFWEDVRPALDSIKPVFMLAEWQEPELHDSAFDASYAWRWKEIMQDIAKGNANAVNIAGYYVDYKQAWPKGAMRMTYTSNHDQNTWDGIPQDIYGDAYEVAMVLSFTGEGIPLIYNGQECANEKRLEFFEKDLIAWRCDDPVNSVFADLVTLKSENPALHNGVWGGDLIGLENSNPQNVFSFTRRKGDNEVLVMMNLSNEFQSFRFSDALPLEQYSSFPANKSVRMTRDELTLPPWGWAVYVRD
ncbi:MAG: alpha-amylase family glycosyl hydrolase [Litorimonas sp.]